MSRRLASICLALVATAAAARCKGSDGGTADNSASGAPATGGSAAATSAGNTNTASATQPTPGTEATPAAANVKAVPWPAIDFVSNPGGNDPMAVALTFDDGPDGAGTLSVPGAGGPGNTAGVLDVLKSLSLKATFFICSKRATDLLQDTTAQADLKRIIAEGHDLANHTVDHAGFDGTLSVAAATQEFAGVQSAINTVLGASAPQLTMYRTPYGKPYQDGLDKTPMYAAATAPFGVHVGWGIDSHDWQCAQGDGSATYNYNGNKLKFEATPECVLNNVKMFVDAKQSGVLLMHAIYRNSVDVLPQIVDLLKTNGYHFVSVEDFIKAKYGGTSAQLAAANKAANFDAQTLQDAAVASVKRSAWVLGTNAN